MHRVIQLGYLQSSDLTVAWTGTDLPLVRSNQLRDRIDLRIDRCSNQQAKISGLRSAVQRVTRGVHPAMAGAVDAAGQSEHASAAAISLPWCVTLVRLKC